MRITKKLINETIEHYEEMPENLKLCIGKFVGDKYKIIEEIKNMTKIGKRLILLHYEFKQSDLYKKIKGGKK